MVSEIKQIKFYIQLRRTKLSYSDRVELNFFETNIFIITFVLGLTSQLLFALVYLDASYRRNYSKEGTNEKYSKQPREIIMAAKCGQTI